MSVPRSLRLQARTQASLDAIGGSLGEIFYDRNSETLRIFNGTVKGGSTLANRDWVNSRLDWANIQNKPTIPVFSPVAVSGSYLDLTNRPTIFSGSYNDLTDKPPAIGTATTTTAGVVKVDGTTITIMNGVISTVGGGNTINAVSDIGDVQATGANAPTNNQALVWNTSASKWRPTTVNAAFVGLGNVTNESKATMFTNPTFTGTVNLGSGAVNLPVGSTIGGAAVATTGLITFSGSTISTSVSSITIAKSTTVQGNLTVTGVLGASINALSDVDTASSPPTVGQVLKWDGTAWKPAADVAAGGANADADTLDGNDSVYYLDYNNFTNTPDLTVYAPIDTPTFTGVEFTFLGKTVTGFTGDGGVLATSESPTFTGTVSGITKSMVGLSNVTNESKSTMFSNPTFTGTVSGVTAAMVGLGNVTNESKTTMFDNPTFTGTVTGVSKSAVGLGNVENTALSTWAGSTNITTVGTLTTQLRVNATGGMGYATGQGGTVTQGTNRTTAVSLNKLSGRITLFNTTASAGTFSFTVNNTLVGADDLIVVNKVTGTAPANVYIPQVTQVTNGSFRISVYVPTAITTNDAPQISFLVLKGVVA